MLLEIFLYIPEDIPHFVFNIFFLWFCITFGSKQETTEAMTMKWRQTVIKLDTKIVGRVMLGKLYIKKVI